MSYKDLRSFTEMMRALGYRRLISMENFRVPNFPLVAEVLIWLVKRYDPNTDIPTDVDTPQDRVIFIKSVAEFMATKAHIKLNTKKLYQADGYAVKELLKVTSVLYSAMKTNVATFQEDSNDSGVSFDISSRVGDLKDARRLASEITAKGATLYDLLGKEVDLREARSVVIARQLEINEVEKGLGNCVKAVDADIKKNMNSIDNVASDEANLEAKIEKKRNELERNQKRLATLHSVRPAYMDEYERLEEDLQKLYDDYMLKFRNSAYLEQLLEEYRRVEQDKTDDMEKTIRQFADKIRTDQKKVDMGEPDSEDSFEGLVDDVGSDGESEDDGIVKPKQRPERPAHTRQRPGGAMEGSVMNKDPASRVKGSMTAALEDDDDDDDSEDLGSDDSDIDLDDDDDDDEDGDSDGGLELGAGANPRLRKQRPLSDDGEDF